MPADEKKSLGRRFCGTGVSLAASPRAPSSPRCWGRQGQAVHGAPQTAGSQAQQWRVTGGYSVEGVGAGCHDNTGAGPRRASLVSVCLWVEHPLLVGGSWEPLPTPHPHRDLQRKGASPWGFVCPKQKRVMTRCSPLVCDMQSLLVYHIYSIRTMLHYFLFCYIKK